MYSEEPSLRRLKCTEIKTGQRRQTPTLDVLSIASFIHASNHAVITENNSFEFVYYTLV